MRIASALVATAALGLLGWRWRADRIAWQRWRDGLLHTCEPLLVNPSTDLDHAGWPQLRGKYLNRAASIELLLDDAGYRKLPVLWMQVTLATNSPESARICAVARPNSNEYWSGHSELNERILTPAQWPSEISVRADHAVSLPEALVQTGSSFFNMASGKELSLARGTVRLTAMAMQARRTEYLVLRTSKFEARSVDPLQARTLLNCAAGIADAMEHSAPNQKVHAI